jgi:hypothetical protein
MPTELNITILTLQKFSSIRCRFWRLEIATTRMTKKRRLDIIDPRPSKSVGIIETWIVLKSLQLMYQLFHYRNSSAPFASVVSFCHLRNGEDVVRDIAVRTPDHWF